MKVEDVMQRDVAIVQSHTLLRDVVAMLAERRISGLPVVDDDGAVVGVLSESDLILKEEGPDLTSHGKLDHLLHPPDPEAVAKLHARTARRAMTSPAITVHPGAPLAYAAELMSERAVNRLPVVEDGKLVGIVTRADLVRAIARDDAEIAREIEEDVVLRRFWLAPESVSVTVEAGRVTLGGEVESEGIAELIVLVVERVPGVVSVESSLSWPDVGPAKGR